jgi:WD40 repeat protein
MIVVLVGGSVVWSGPALPACAPSWSPDGRFVAFAARSSGTRGAAVTRIVDMRGGKIFDLPDAGPVAWGPPEAGSGHVTAISKDCRSILSFDVENGAATKIATIPGMSGLRTKWGSSCPVIAMAWSPAFGPAWLAVAMRGDDATPGRVLVFGVVSRHVFDLTSAEGLVTRSLSWSPDGTAVLVGAVDHGGSAVTVLAQAADAWIGERLPVGSASWSPDSHWILGRDADGWAAYAATDPRVTVRLTVPRSATTAAWCCPPVPSYPALPAP